jgi:hypothetical protein
VLQWTSTKYNDRLDNFFTQFSFQLVPEQPTKLLPLAPVWMISPASLPAVLKIRRSGPGLPVS